MKRVSIFIIGIIILALFVSISLAINADTGFLNNAEPLIKDALFSPMDPMTPNSPYCQDANTCEEKIILTN